MKKPSPALHLMQIMPDPRRSLWWLMALLLSLALVDCGPQGPQQELVILPEGSGATDRQTDGPPLTQEVPQTDTSDGSRPSEPPADPLAPDQPPVDRAVADQPGDGSPGDQSSPPDLISSDHPDSSLPEPQPEPSFEPPAPDVQPPDVPQPPDTPPADRTTTPDYVGTPCSVNGVAGTCKNVSDCVGDNQATPGHCPGPKGIQCCTPKSSSSSSCDPNAVPQPNAGLQEAPGQGGCKPGMVKVSTFCIDQYEASLVEVLSNGTTRPWSPYYNPGTTKVRAVSVRGAVPQGYINGIQAANACKQAGKRLCTDTEWLRACQSANKYTYPYGNTRQPGVCNDARSKHPAVEYWGSSQQWVFSRIQHQCINQLPASLAKTGSYSGCKTVENVYDMMGNLHEWTATSSGIFRGGYYVDTYRNGNGCYYRTTAHNTQHWDYSTGFRCCWTP